jgi:hypothetical protein
MATPRACIALLIAALLVAAPACSAEEETFEIEAEDEEKDVVVLTDANFDETLKKHRFALVRGRAGE